MNKDISIYLKFVQVFVTFFMTAQVYTCTLADHGEVGLFRERSASKIAQQKGVLNTQFDVVGALGVLESELTTRPLESSRLILGMMVGNGFKSGVTSKLKASASDIIIIKRVVQKAAAYIRDFNCSKNHIWYEDLADDSSVTKHASVLNSWVAAVKQADPHLSCQSKPAVSYSSLDQNIRVVGTTYHASTVIQRAIKKSTSPNANSEEAYKMKRFILCFAKLATREQSLIEQHFSISMNKDEEVSIIAANCENLEKAQDFAQGEATAFIAAAVVREREEAAQAAVSNRARNSAERDISLADINIVFGTAYNAENIKKILDRDTTATNEYNDVTTKLQLYIKKRVSQYRKIPSTIVTPEIYEMQCLLNARLRELELEARVAPRIEITSNSDNRDENVRKLVIRSISQYTGDSEELKQFKQYVRDIRLKKVKANQLFDAILADPDRCRVLVRDIPRTLTGVVAKLMESKFESTHQNDLVKWDEITRHNKYYFWLLRNRLSYLNFVKDHMINTFNIRLNEDEAKSYVEEVFKKITQEEQANISRK